MNAGSTPQASANAASAASAYGPAKSITDGSPVSPP